jgi:hypothetical protein
MMINTVKFSFALALACLFFSTAMAAGLLPKMTGNISCQECSDAFRLAKCMFHSKSPRVYAPLNIPDGMNSELVLGATAFDISGGDELEFNDDLFEKVPQLGEGTIGSVYWEKNSGNGVRIVVKEMPMGWHGDMYSLYLLKANVSQNDFLKDIQANYGKSRYSALVQGAWRPPLVFIRESTPKMWFIIVGEPYEILADWTVYKETSIGFEQSCIIKFHPKMTNAKDLLPKSVQTFAHLVDETIGPGRDEGTLQSTARLRLSVQHVWANVALRPWALSDSDTYNSTDEVKVNLIEWSKNGSSYNRIYKEIMQTYPIAEQDLSNYYMKQFHLKKNKAKKLSKWVLDIAFRANYTFHGEYFRYNNVNTNPWSEDFKH